MRLALLLILLVISCSSAETEKLYERSFHVMGSRVELKFYSPSERLFHRVVEASLERMGEIDRIFSNYREDSVLAEVNRSAGVGPVSVPREFLFLTRASIDYSELTEGAFDITVGGLFELWRAAAAAGKVPSETEIAGALECAGFRKIRLDEEKSRISFASDCLRLDFGAVGKGYAVDRIMEIAKENGIKRGLVNFGGNIFALGSPDGKEFWEVAVAAPGGGFVSRLGLRDRGIATSGDYERYFEFPERKYSHIIDPMTGHPSENSALVIAVARTAAEADVFSTAISVLRAGAAREFAQRDGFLGFIVVGKNGEKESYFGASVFPKR